MIDTASGAGNVSGDRQALRRRRRHDHVEPTDRGTGQLVDSGCRYHRCHPRRQLRAQIFRLAADRVQPRRNRTRLLGRRLLGRIPPARGAERLLLRTPCRNRDGGCEQRAEADQRIKHRARCTRGFRLRNSGRHGGRRGRDGCLHRDPRDLLARFRVTAQASQCHLQRAHALALLRQLQLELLQLRVGCRLDGRGRCQGSGTCGQGTRRQRCCRGCRRRYRTAGAAAASSCRRAVPVGLAGALARATSTLRASCFGADGSALATRIERDGRSAADVALRLRSALRLRARIDGAALGSTAGCDRHGELGFDARIGTGRCFDRRRRALVGTREIEHRRIEERDELARHLRSATDGEVDRHDRLIERTHGAHAHGTFVGIATGAHLDPDLVGAKPVLAGIDLGDHALARQFLVGRDADLRREVERLPEQRRVVGGAEPHRLHGRRRAPRRRADGGEDQGSAHSVFLCRGSLALPPAISAALARC